MPLTQERFPGLVYLCGTSWPGSVQAALMLSPSKIWKAELVLASRCPGGQGCPCGAAVLGLWDVPHPASVGQEHVGLCCLEAACAVALRGDVEGAAAADAQDDFPSWWHYCAHCWQGESSGARRCVSSGGSQGCHSPFPAFPKGPEPQGWELQFLLLSILVLLWL